MKKRKDGRYCKQILVGYKPDGKRILKTIYGKTIKEVEKQELEIRKQLEAQIRITDDLTVAEWANEWFDTYKIKSSYYTRRRYESILKIHIIPTIGDMQLRKVKLSHVQKLINNLNGYSMSTIKKVRDTIHQLFVTAISNELTYKDPTIGVVLPRIIEKEKEILNQDVIQKLNDFCLTHDCGTFVMTLLYTGMRRGEIIALTWNDIDFSANLIHVTKAVVFRNNQPVISYPKTKHSIRDIPILNNLRIILERYKEKYTAEYGEDIENKPVFLNSLGHMHSESSINKFWKRFLREYNHYYETKINFGMHQFRHTFCTLLYNADVDIKTAQAVLGHSDVTVTLSIYTHLEEKQKSLSIDKLNNYLSQSKVSQT